MIVVNTVAEMRRARAALSGSVGLVPTMGYLHEGHLTLVRTARRENDSVVATIFVNPTQFGPSEDLSAYPRDLARDLRLLEAESVDVAMVPDTAVIYPAGFSTSVDVGPIASRLEGASRAGHFRGVATVVAKLFNIVQPDRAYFGQKDAQQCAVIKRLTTDLNFDLEMVVCPTVREQDGLAMSSRNSYLNSEERAAAAVVPRALFEAQAMYVQGERDAEVLRRLVGETIEREPLARLDYVSVADAQTLDELSAIDRPALVSMAVRIGRTRLIDNVALPPAWT